jgi:hypothetical protein
MKRIVSIWIMCIGLSLGSFAILVIEDRRLDLPVPYTVALAFASMLLLSVSVILLLHTAGDRIAERRRLAGRAGVQAARAATRRTVEGVVLLDLSHAGAVGGEPR